MKKPRLTLKTMKVLKAMIDVAQTGENPLCVNDLAKSMDLTIHDAVYQLKKYKAIHILKRRGMLYAQVLIGHADLDKFTTGNAPRGQYKNRKEAARVKKKAGPCPYRGRRYQDVPKGTYDAAIHCRAMPSRQRDYAFGNSGGMCADA